MIGIEFEYNINYTNIFKTLLKNINLDNYEWEIAELDACTKNGKDISQMFSNDIRKIVKSKEDYMTMFANIRVYPQRSEISSIDNYEDFVNSECELIILIYDVGEFEIYFKKNELKEQILKNIKELKINYTEKTTENDGRTEMYVF